MLKLMFAIAVALSLSVINPLGAQPIKMTIGQTGVNPGTGPYVIARPVPG